MILVIILIVVVIIYYNSIKNINTVNRPVLTLSYTTPAIYNQSITKVPEQINIPDFITGLESGAVCWDFSTMYPGLPVNDPNFLGTMGYGKPENYTVYNSVTGNPHFFDVMQSLLGDCVFDSTVAVLAVKQRKIIQNMIYTSPSEVGIFYVKFYKDGKPFLIKINDELPLATDLSEVSKVDGYQQGAFDEFYVDPNKKIILWPHIILKAFACIINYFPPFFSGYTDKDGNTAYGYNAIDNGLNGKDLLNIITNQTSRYIYPPFTNYYDNFNDPTYLCVACSRRVDEFTQPPKLDGFTIKVHNDPAGFLFTDSGGRVVASIIEGHGYSVLGYYPNTQTIQLRNPWGTFTLDSDHYYQDGIMNVPVAIFEYIYDLIFYLKSENTL